MDLTLRADTGVDCKWGKVAEVEMGLAQSAGMLVTIAVVIGVDLPVDWLVPLAMICGGLAIFAVRMWEQTRG